MFDRITILGGNNKDGAAEPIQELTVSRGESISVIGQTGSGKSLLARDIEQLAQGDTLSRRMILVDGTDPGQKYRSDPAYKIVSHLSQNMNYTVDLPCTDFLRMRAECRGFADPRGNARAIIETANALCGEPVPPDAPLTGLSGGQSRALMTADTAINAAAPVILIDEIENAGIDVQAALGLLLKADKIVFLVTHSPLLALSCGRRLVMRNGGMEALLTLSDGEKETLRQLERLNAWTLSALRKLRAGERANIEELPLHANLRGESDGIVPYAPRGRESPSAEKSGGAGLSVEPAAKAAAPPTRPYYASTARLRVYWNNICLLRRREDAFLTEYGENLDITYFGLGTPRKLRTRIKRDIEETGGINADVIVSTELDIFQDRRLLRGKNLFRKIDFPSGPFIDRAAVSADPCLAVSLILPMFIASAPSNPEYPRTLRELCEPRYRGKIVLGGRDTAAGRSVVMTLWYLYGEAAARSFLDNAVFTTIPAAARYCIVRGEYPVGILPSALCGYGVRAVFPADGAPAIPAFAAVSRTADPDDAHRFLNILFGWRMQAFYAERAFAIPSSGRLSPLLYPDAAPPAYCYPPGEWLDRFDMERFTALMDSP
jgi:ABC-type lipoprotein export system ATPase subunit